MAETAKLFDEPIKVLPYPAEAGLSGALFLRNVSKSDDQNADKAASGYNHINPGVLGIVATNYIQLESRGGQPWSILDLILDPVYSIHLTHCRESQGYRIVVFFMLQSYRLALVCLM